ncbi:MAG: hypothetical protein WC552_09760 [Candidatus Omnitrophota bacterium]
MKDARAALEAETHEVVRVSNRLNDNLVKAGKIIWRQLLLLWAVVVVLGVSYFLILNNARLATHQAKQGKGSGAVSTLSETAGRLQPGEPPTLSALPAIPEAEDLLRLLDQVRQAQLTKDIHLFLGAYAPSFPNLTRKREVTLNIWKKYDYLESQFQIREAVPKSDVLILAKVTWNIKARDRKTDEIKNISKSYQVNFSKESGQWLIQNLKPVEGKEDLE